MSTCRSVFVLLFAAAAGGLAVPAYPAGEPAPPPAVDGAACSDIQDQLVTPELFRRCLARTDDPAAAGDSPAPAGTPSPAGLRIAAASPAPGMATAALPPKGLPVVKLAPGGSSPAAAAAPAGTSHEEVSYGPPGLADAPLRFVSLKPVHFEFDKAELSATDKGVLDDIARYLLGQKNLRRVLLIGYADHDGSRAHNYKLSVQRTKVVADYLAAQGVASGLLYATAHGARRPVDQSWLPEGRARNRRVELYAVER